MSDRSSSPWTDVLGGVLALTAMAFVAATYGAIVPPPSGDLVAEVEHMVVGHGLGALAVAGFAAVWPTRLGWRGEVGLGAWILGAYVLWMLAWVPFSLLLYPQFVTPEPQPHLKYFVVAGSKPAFVAALAVVCLLGPIAEEIVFRGYLQTGLGRLIGSWPALIVTSLLFGFLHGLDIGLPLALMGLFFGYLRMRDRGMLAPIAAHVLHNSVTVAVALGWPELFDEVFSK